LQGAGVFAVSSGCASTAGVLAVAAVTGARASAPAASVAATAMAIIRTRGILAFGMSDLLRERAG
jgi:hypothetical protein